MATPTGMRRGALEDELHFLWVAARKTEQIREDLGSAGDVIAAQVEQKMLGRREDWQAVDVEIERRAGAAAPSSGSFVTSPLDLQKLTETLNESRGDLASTPEAVEHVVRTALDARLRQGPEAAFLARRASSHCASASPSCPAPGPRPGTTVSTTKITHRELPVHV